MNISDDIEYRQAKERANKLRSSGASAEYNAELAELEAAIADYGLADGGPGESKGRPGS